MLVVEVVVDQRGRLELLAPVVVLEVLVVEVLELEQVQNFLVLLE